jgi:hypothetical protein
MECIQQTWFPGVQQSSTEGCSRSGFSNQPISAEIILFAFAMYFRFGSAHMAKGYPRNIPGFRHNQREQNERCRSDASRVGYATHTQECHIQAPAASGQECRLWDAERLYLPTTPPRISETPSFSEITETVLAPPATATTSMHFLFSRLRACVYMIGRAWRQYAGIVASYSFWRCQ